MFKKEDNIKYFIGGTAMGITVGYCLSKLLHPAMSAVESKSFVSNKPADQKKSKYSQDDNIYNSLYSHKNTHSCHARSKSTSRYDENVSKEFSSAPSTLETLINKDKARNTMLECNLQMNSIKTFQNKEIPLCDISMENNIFYFSDDTKTNIFSKDCFNYFEKNKCNTYSSKFNKTDSEDEHLTSSMIQFNLINNIIDETDIQHKISSKKINNESANIISKEDQLKCVEHLNCTEQPTEINTLSNNFHTNANVISNCQDVQNSVGSPHVLKTYLEEDTNLATCNTASNFEDSEHD